MHAFVHGLMAASLALLLLCSWLENRLPPPTDILPIVHMEPVQKDTAKTRFDTTVGGVVYTVKPVQEYELWGLVVSGHDADGWMDYIHAQWNDKLNVADLCVLWGKNVVDDLYDKISFSSGQFTCNYSMRSREVFEAFDKAQISNNHLLTDNADLARLVRSAHVGDQIHFKGWLAEYSHHEGGGFHRGTSLIRTDTGNGACEVVYLREFEILRVGNALWRNLWWLSLLVLIGSVIGWFFLPVRIRHE